MKIQIGFFSLLGLLFIALKLTGIITWSWWLVTLPLWFGWALIGIILLIGAATTLFVFFLAVLFEFYEAIKNGR